MNISQTGIDLIKGFESCAEAIGGGMYRAYWDSMGHVWTIGWGHTAGVYEGQIISQAQADELLAQDVAAFSAAVNNAVTVRLNQSQFDALVSFSYNVGAGAFRKSTLLKLLNANDYAGAAAQFPLWNKAGGVVQPGLVTRRAAERALFESGATAAEIDEREEPAEEFDNPIINFVFDVINRALDYIQSDSAYRVGDTVIVKSDTNHGKKYGLNKTGQKFRNFYKTYTVYAIGTKWVYIGKHEKYQSRVKPEYINKV